MATGPHWACAPRSVEVFKDVFVTEDARLMPEGLYFQAAARFAHRFATLASTYLGVAHAACDYTVQYLRGG